MAGAVGILDTIGNTPLVSLGSVRAKLETTNPSGSIKDRMAAFVVAKAEERGELLPGARILEVTSGNTGIALAMVSAIKGYRFTAVMPESMSIERRRMISGYGAQIVLTPAERDMAGAVAEYDRLAEKYPDAWLPRQFSNPDNVGAYRSMAQEILDQTGGKVDAFVAGVGTGGTLIGVGKVLKESIPEVRIIAVEPAESAVLSGKEPGLHRIQGIGEGFIPQIIERNMHLIDDVLTVAGRDAIAMSLRLARENGILVGISSGANLIAAQRLAEMGYKNVVTVFPDRGERYLSGRMP